jgi:hypothetical protein
MKRNGYIIKTNGMLKAYTDTNDGGCVAQMHIDKWEVTEVTISECAKLANGLYKVVWGIYKAKYRLVKITKVNKDKELEALKKKAGNRASFKSNMGGLKSQDAIQRIVTSNQERKIKRANKYIRLLFETYEMTKAKKLLLQID